MKKSDSNRRAKENVKKRIGSLRSTDPSFEFLSNSSLSSVLHDTRSFTPSGAFRFSTLNLKPGCDLSQPTFNYICDDDNPPPRPNIILQLLFTFTFIFFIAPCLFLLFPLHLILLLLSLPVLLYFYNFTRIKYTWLFLYRASALYLNLMLLRRAPTIFRYTQIPDQLKFITPSYLDALLKKHNVIPQRKWIQQVECREDENSSIGGIRAKVTDGSETEMLYFFVKLKSERIFAERLVNLIDQDIKVELNSYASREHLGFEVPKLYASDYSNSTGKSLFVFEDISLQGEFFSHNYISDEQIQKMLKLLASFHALHWEAQRPFTTDFLNFNTETPHISFFVHYHLFSMGINSLAKNLRENLDFTLPPTLIELIHTFCSHYTQLSKIIRQYLHFPEVLNHGNFHIGNICLNDGELYVFDLDTMGIHIGPGRDLASLFCQLPTALLEEKLNGWLEFYMRAMRKNGVSIDQRKLEFNLAWNAILILEMPAMCAHAGNNIADNPTNLLCVENAMLLYERFDVFARFQKICQKAHFGVENENMKEKENTKGPRRKGSASGIKEAYE